MPDHPRSFPLSYGISLLAHCQALPYHVFGADNHYVEKFDLNDRDNLNVLKTDYKLRCQILQQVRERKIALICDESPVIYAGVQCLDGLTLIAGPVVMARVDQNFMQLYANKHHAAGCPLQYCEPARLAAVVLIVYSGVYGAMLSVNELLDQNFLTPEVIELTQKRVASVFSKISIEAKPHNPVTLELNIRRAIRSGSEQLLKEALDSPYAAMRGTLAASELRSAQNLAIVDITIATREAIECGLSVEELYMLSDAFILQVEDCRYPADCAALARACARRCTQLVAASRRESGHDTSVSAMVLRARNYIDRHLYEKIDVSAMACTLKISEGYLSRIFKEGTSMTLLQYARRRKVELAATLLAGSDKSLQEIAAMLGFSSQSHFGQVFREIMKLTPRQYRNLHKY